MKTNLQTIEQHCIEQLLHLGIEVDDAQAIITCSKLHPELADIMPVQAWREPWVYCSRAFGQIIMHIVRTDALQWINVNRPGAWNIVLLNQPNQPSIN